MLGALMWKIVHVGVIGARRFGSRGPGSQGLFKGVSGRSPGENLGWDLGVQAGLRNRLRDVQGLGVTKGGERVQGLSRVGGEDGPRTGPGGLPVGLGVRPAGKSRQRAQGSNSGYRDGSWVGPGQNPGMVRGAQGAWEVSWGVQVAIQARLHEDPEVELGEEKPLRHHLDFNLRVGEESYTTDGKEPHN